MQLRLVAVFLLAWAPGIRAQDTEIIRGRITDSLGKPVAQVTVVVTGLSTSEVRTAQTTAAGNYSVTFTDPEGDYVVAAHRVGYAPQTGRVTRNGLSATMALDFTLKTTAVRVSDLAVTADRPLPSRTDRPSIGGIEQNMLAGALFTLDPSDLLALATQIPGVLAVGDSAYSVLGAPSDQNNTTLDGTSFGGGNVPRDAVASTRLVTTSSDPSKGGFAGGQTVVTTRKGTNVFGSTMRGQIADQHLAWADPSSPSPVPEIAGVSGVISGPIVRSKVHYLLSYDGSNTKTDAFSLLAPRDALLSQLGLQTDTINAVRAALGQLGVPLTARGVPDANNRLAGSGLLNLDYHPNATTTMVFTATRQFSTTDGNGISQSAFPSSASQSWTHSMAFTLNTSSYLNGFLEELRVSYQPSGSHSAPYLELPSGSVRVGSVFDSDRTGLSSLRFGGNGAGPAHSNTGNGVIHNEISWLTRDSKHQVKFMQEAILNWNTALSAGNAFGSYGYQSIDDLLADLPSSFNRTVSFFQRSSHGMTSAFSLGDTWHPKLGLDFQGGVRFDLVHFGTRPDENPAIDSLFGRHTSHVPNAAGFSPRLGFSWTPGLGRRRAPTPVATPPMSPAAATALSALAPGVAFTPGTTVQGSAVQLGALPGPRPVISGSVGVLRGTISPSRIASLVDATGLPSTTLTLSCVGPATPVPDWSDPASLSPDDCLDGTAAGSFAASQPSISVFDPSFQAPISWRGNLQVSNIVKHGLRISPSVVYSFGENLESRLDYNLQRTAGFTLADEGNRPVYVSPSEIVPTTGAIAPGANRITNRFGRVSDIVSDLHSSALQFNLSLNPVRPVFRKFPIAFQYSFNDQRTETRGFSGSTAGDPFAKEWTPGQQPYHQFVLSTSGGRIWWLALGVRFNVLSGQPYTPTVVGDVNGDGLSNDRAFIANPATTADPALAAQMAQLIGSAPAGARACLQAQFGRVAGAGSCRTPWQARFDLNLQFLPPSNFALGSRLHMTMNFLNASGALVRLFGLQNTLLGQTPQSTSVDPRLLYVTGFDPVAERFQYRVNQLFGEPLDFGTTRNRYPPFQLQLGMEYRFAGASTTPLLSAYGLLPRGKEKQLTVAEARAALDRTVRNPLQLILDRRDTLGLSDLQVRQLDSLSDAFTVAVHAVMQPLIDYVVARGRKLTDLDFNARRATINQAVSRTLADFRNRGNALLTPVQRRYMTGGLPARP